MESVKNWVQPQCGAKTLYVSINEIPQPRGWVERNLPKITATVYQQVQFDNVFEPLQQRIEQILNH